MDINLALSDGSHPFFTLNAYPNKYDKKVILKWLVNTMYDT